MILILGGVLGHRRTEIATQHSDNYDPGTGILTVVGKGRRLRSLTVPDDYRCMFEAASGWLVPSPLDAATHMHPNTVYRHACRALKAGYTTHSLRHRAGCTVQELAHDLRTTQDFLGHSNPTTTVIYTRPTTDQMRTILTESGARLRNPEQIPFC